MMNDDWKQRVYDEKETLDEKIDKLQAFMDYGKDFKMLPTEDQVLLELQHNYMIAYTHVLAHRVDRFI